MKNNSNSSINLVYIEKININELEIISLIIS